MNEKKPVQSRRRFLHSSASLTLGGLLLPSSLAVVAGGKSCGSKSPGFEGVRLGVISYSFRSMADQSAEATLRYVLDSGLNAVELMGDPAESFAGCPVSPVDVAARRNLQRKKRRGESLSPTEQQEFAEMSKLLEAHTKELAEWRSSVSMDKFVELRELYEKSDVEIYAFKPAVLKANNTDAEIDYGFRAAKALGANHLTVELPTDPAHTAKLAKFAARHELNIAYHGHLQQTATVWDTALSQSNRNLLNLDLGHYIAAGNQDVFELLRAKHQHIASMHVKDRRTPANDRTNMPFGQGDTPVGEVLQLMRDQQYTFPATIELEYEIPEGSDAVREVVKCVAYCRQALKS